MPIKVFELAKELGIGPLDLVEELKKHGFSVRNHMAALADDEVTKVKGLLKATKETTAAAPAPKKAVTRKKVAAKTEAPAAPAVEEAPPKVLKAPKAPKVVEEKPAPVVVAPEPVEVAAPVAPPEAPVAAQAPVVEDEEKGPRKSTVIRRKTKEDGDGPFSGPGDSQSAFASALQAAEAKDGTDEFSDRPSGLRVVSRPAAAKAAAEAEGPKGTGKDYYEEKVHRFTPVFIPEKKVGAPAGTAAAGTPESEEDKAKSGDRDDLDSVTGKKRLGSLASMMSGKKMTVGRSQLLSETKTEEELKTYSALSGLGRPIYTQIKKKKTYMGPTEQTMKTEVKESKRVVQIHKGVRATELASKLNVKFSEFVDQALDLNLLLKEIDYLGITLASEIAALYGYRVEDVSFNEDKALGKVEVTKEEHEKLPLRDPIITIMGHVDHGKTTLLDYIRKAKVAAGEAGGITQHIGAYSVKANGKTLTFLDTPGHAAFASMRQRGANITDIVVLVVAADDGVMPQTRESVKYCQNAKVPLIVAVNKMDKEGVNPDRIKTELTEFHITPEEWGGETPFIPISALKGTGVDNLLEAIALQAEVMELRADNKGPAEGVVIESKIEQGRGPVATILVEAGTLNKGDSIVVGETYGRARSLMDSSGAQLQSAGPAVPVQILGLENVPSPGDIMNVVKNEREAKRIVDNRIEERKKMENLPAKKKVSLEDFFAGVQASGEETKSMNLIVRSDVQGSYEAIKQAVEALGNMEVGVKVIGGGVGAITDSDVQLASSSGAYVIGFNMRPVTSARRLAEEKGVDIKNYSIIYELINDVKLAIEGMLAPEFNEEYIGRAEVREVFSIPKIGSIAGSSVVDGKMAVHCKIRLLRNGKIVHDGKLSSLKRFKDDVKEVKTGLECGIALENYNDVKVGDIFEAYLMVERKRTLEDVEKAEKAAASASASAEVRA